MEYRIVHELPRRLRIHLSLPGRAPADRDVVEAHLRDVAGVDSVSFSPRTRSLLVQYDGEAYCRTALLEAIEAAPLPGARRRPAPELERKKQSVLRSGALLLSRSLIPPPLRPLVAFWGALPVFRKGAASLRKWRLGVDVLDSAAIGAAMASRDFTTASVIAFLLKLGDYLEEWTKGRSRKLLTEMFHAGEEWAWVVRDGEEARVSLGEVREGNTVVARMGSLIPVDGLVAEGEALVNQSSLTGESLPVLKREGHSVYAGTAVEEGVLRVRAVKVGIDTRAARVVQLIQEAEVLKAESQRKAEVLADRVVPFSFLLSGLTLALTGNPSRAAAVLLVDYSCAIKLSTPLAVLSSLAKAARHRVLIKGGKYLEKLSVADAFILDKTGTLTEAAPKVVEVVAFNGFDRDYVLRQAACVEEHFPHPVAAAVVRQAAREKLSHAEEHAEVEYVLAHGIVSRVDGERIVVGSRHFVEEDESVDVCAAETHLEAFAGKGCSTLLVAIGGELAGVVAIHDPLRAEARPFVDELRAAGVRKIVLLTGDNEASARAVAKRLGISDFRAEVLPDTKMEVIRGLQREGYTVAMVGDGINDSPALACADVGISMKHGADIAKEACDVLLLEGSLADILTARQIAREGMELIEENFRAILAINSAGLILALSGLASPAFSALLHNAGTVGVALRALAPLRHPAGGRLSG